MAFKFFGYVCNIRLMWDVPILVYHGDKRITENPLRPKKQTNKITNDHHLMHAICTEWHPHTLSHHACRCPSSKSSQYLLTTIPCVVIHIHSYAGVSVFFVCVPATTGIENSTELYEC